MGIFTSAEKKHGLKKLKEEPCKVTVSAEVPADEVQADLQTALVQIQSRARLPGFRPGKAPLNLVEQKFADDAKQRVLDQAIRKVLPDALKEFQIQPVASPYVHDIKFEKGKALSFQLSFEVAPKFEPKDYKKLTLDKPAAPNADKAVDERLQTIRESNARLEKSDKDKVGKDHYVVVDYEGTLEGKPIEGGKAENELVDMSAPQTVEGLTEGLLGLKIGDQKDIAVTIEGKSASFKVTVKDLKKKVLPELDDELSKDLGFPTVAELKAKVREVTLKEHEAKSERAVREQIDDKLAAANAFPLPPSVVESQMSSMLERLKGQWHRSGRPWPEKEEPKLLEKLKPEAEKSVRLSYVLQAIAHKEGLDATEDEMKAEREKNITAAPNEKEKQALNNFFDEHKDEIAAVIRERKVYEFITKNAKVSVKES
jgi:trigger factor